MYIYNIYILSVSTGHQTFSKPCPTKPAPQHTHLCGVKLSKFFISYRRLKTQKHLVSIDVFCSGIYFYEHFNRQFTEEISLYSKPYDVFE